MFCPNCGKQVPDSTKFCPYCGTRFDRSSEAGAPMPPVDPDPVDSGEPEPGSVDPGEPGSGPQSVDPVESGPVPAPAPDPVPTPAPDPVPAPEFEPQPAAAPAPAPAEPEPKPRRSRVPFITLGVVAVVVLAALGFVLLGGFSGTDALDEGSYTVAYYDDEEALAVGGSTQVVLYSSEGEALEDYDLALMDDEGAVALYHVDGAFFTPDELGVPAGSYTMVGRDPQTKRPYTVPVFEVVDEEEAEEGELPEQIRIDVDDGADEADADEAAGETDTADDASDTDDTTDTALARQDALFLYYQKVVEYQELHGSCAITTNSVLDEFGESYYEGLCLVYLLDIDGDGIEELLLGYLTEARDEWPYLSYAIELWRYDAEAGAIASAYEGTLTDVQDLAFLQIFTLDAGYSVMWTTGDEDGIEYCFIFSDDDAEGGIGTQSATSSGDSCSVDGVEVDYEAFEEVLNEHLYKLDYESVEPFYLQYYSAYEGTAASGEALGEATAAAIEALAQGMMGLGSAASDGADDVADDDEAPIVSINLTSDEVYQQYYEKLQELIDEYGEGAAQESSSTGSQWMSGVCFAQLLDFNGDNQDELLVVYSKKSPDETSFSSEYCCEIWGLNETDMYIYMGNFVGDEHCFYLVEIDGRSYLSAFDISDAYSVYGYDDENDRLNELMAFRDYGGSITVNGVYHETYYTMDGEECTQEEYEAAYATYVEAATSYVLCYNEGDFSALNVLAETLAFLEDYA